MNTLDNAQPSLVDLAAEISKLESETFEIADYTDASEVMLAGSTSTSSTSTSSSCCSCTSCSSSSTSCF